eukprot:5429442-Heterocapsa_arctica.AAC.1
MRRSLLWDIWARREYDSTDRGVRLLWPGPMAWLGRRPTWRGRGLPWFPWTGKPAGERSPGWR